jgi:hypothetical protein
LAFAIVLVLLVLVLGYRALEGDGDPAPTTSSAVTPSITPAVEETHPAADNPQGFLYGRISTIDGATYLGRLRWGGGEEAFWGDYFNGTKDDNRWAAFVPPERLTEPRRPLEILGVEIARRDRQIELSRPFMARFGDIAQIEASGTDVRVTLKSGTIFDLDRFAASDFDDGLRVWDRSRGVVDLDSLRVRTIEFLPTPSLGATPYRLHGTVRTRHGGFSGFVQWDREKCVGPDPLDGNTADGALSLRFDTIRSIARRSHESSLVTLLDGREIVLSDTRDVGHGNRGIYVDDPRYGRVLISWDAFERVDFSPGGSGAAYIDFAPGRSLEGRVTTRGGNSFAGRLVYDLDESETTETLDAPSEGVDYTIPFGLIVSIAPRGREEREGRRATVILEDGEELLLERAGDLGEGNAGMLVFVEGRRSPEYVPWAEIERIDFDRPAPPRPAVENPAGG